LRQGNQLSNVKGKGNVYPACVLKWGEEVLVENIATGNRSSKFPNRQEKNVDRKSLTHIDKNCVVKRFCKGKSCKENP